MTIDDLLIRVLKIIPILKLEALREAGHVFDFLNLAFAEAVTTISLDNIDRASPGFVDRQIHGEQHAKGISVLSCEKSFRKLSDTVAIP